jgi:putative transposase
MARLARLALGGVPHLVAQRTAQRALFRDEVEARRLLALLREALLAADIALHGYALLPDGLWLLATPARGAALGGAMQALGRHYVRWLNDRRGERGALFAGRYSAAPLEAERELLPALRYVEWRPLAAGAAAAPEDYPWSSAAHHVGLATDPNLRPHPLYWALGNTPFERQAAWRALLQAGVPAADAQRYERALRGGWIVGSPEFERQIEAAAPRRLRPAQPGRPRRTLVTQ